MEKRTNQHVDGALNEKETNRQPQYTHQPIVRRSSERDRRSTASRKPSYIERRAARLLQPKGVETLDAKDVIKKSFRARRVARAARLIWFAWVLIPPQVIFAIISIVGLASEVVAEEVFFGFFSGAVPGEAIYLVMSILVIIIGTLSLLYAVLVFLSARVSLLSGKGLLVLAVCFCLYALPVFNIFPWVFVYSLYLGAQYIKEG